MNIHEFLKMLENMNLLLNLLHKEFSVSHSSTNLLIVIGFKGVV